MKIVLLYFFLFASIIAHSQSKSLDYEVDSEVFQEKRTISVFLPASYSENPTKEFIVAYLFDSQFEPYFSMVSSIMSYYEQTNEGVPMIVVGIHTTKRWDEFVPVSKNDEATQIDGADKLTLFLSSEVYPLIKSRYRTKPFNVGIGHSLGGTYVLNEVTKKASIFNAVIAVSPNLTMYDEQIIHQAEEFYVKSSDDHRFIYTSAGTVGEMELGFKNSLIHLDSISLALAPRDLLWKCDILQGQNHMTTFVPAFNNGYLALSSKLMLLDEELLNLADDPGKTIEDDLIGFYNELALFNSENQGLTIELLMNHVHTLSAYGRHKASVELCQFALRMLEVEELTKKEKKTFEEMINSRLTRAEFNLLAAEADILAEVGDYINASKIYIQAFDLDLIKATHMIRMKAVPVLTQAGEIEEAFVQLDLLANKFALGGNASFIDDPLCSPLHNDPRWDILMQKLAQNAELYK